MKESESSTCYISSEQFSISPRENLKVTIQVRNRHYMLYLNKQNKIEKGYNHAKEFIKMHQMRIFVQAKKKLST